MALLVRKALMAYSCIFIRNADRFDVLMMLIKATLMKIKWTWPNEDRRWWWAINYKTIFGKRVYHQNAIITVFIGFTLFVYSGWFFQLNIARRKVTFQTLQVNNTSHKVLKAVVTLLTKQPLTSTTQLLMARNVKLMNYTAVEKYESTSRLVLLQRIR